MNFSVESTPKACFSLKFNDISTSDVFANYPVTNNVGTINATRTIATWYSVNLENILGDLYNKYETFNLRLNSVSYQQTAAFGVNPYDRLVYFSIEGPAWANNNYSITRKTNIAGAVCGLINFVQNVAAAEVYDNSFICTFRKQKVMDIKICLLTLDGTPPTLAAATQFPRTSFFFDVLPCE